MKEMFGWVQVSDMAGIYVHLSGRDLDGALLKAHGMEKPETKDTIRLVPKICERCQEKNGYTNKFCARCGFPIYESTKLQIMKQESDMKKANNILDEMLKDKRFQETFVKRLQ